MRQASGAGGTSASSRAASTPPVRRGSSGAASALLRWTHISEEACILLGYGPEWQYRRGTGVAPGGTDFSGSTGGAGPGGSRRQDSRPEIAAREDCQPESVFRFLRPGCVAELAMLAEGPVRTPHLDETDAVIGPEEGNLVIKLRRRRHMESVSRMIRMIRKCLDARASGSAVARNTHASDVSPRLQPLGECAEEGARRGEAVPQTRGRGFAD